MRTKAKSSRFVLAQALGLGSFVGAGLLALLLMRFAVPGTPVVPAKTAARFSVAVLAGPKQAAQQAPANADTVAPSVVTSPEPVSVPVVTAQRATSLPKAVKAAQEAAPTETAVAPPVEVLPPAEVSMPGGQLVAEDASVGDDAPDPFAIKPRQVYIRLLVNAQGQVVRNGIIRSGGDAMRDSLILKAMRSRTYATDKLIRIDGNEPLWQLDLVLDYGTNDFLP
jgi:hypothetical protein